MTRLAVSRQAPRGGRGLVTTRGAVPGLGVLAALLGLVLALSACVTVVVEAPRPSPAADASRWTLVWADEFDGTELDASRWSPRGSGPRREAVNSPEAVALDGKGHLVLSTRLRDGVIETAMIGSQGKFERLYGYFECRAMVPRTEGHWAAFWLQSPSFGRWIGDPGRSGVEIDVVEIVRPSRNLVTHNLFWDGYGPRIRFAGLGRPGTVLVPGLREGFHSFGLEWSPEGYVFYVDGVRTWSHSGAVSAVPEYLILSLEVGLLQARVVRSRPDFSDDFVVDYVRVYAPAGEGAD